MTTSPVWPVPTLVPIHPLRTLIKFVSPIPIPSIFIISSLILNRSDPLNEVIPENATISETEVKFVESPVVVPVETIGDCIILSIATKHLVFWFLAINLWEVPIPTLSNFNAIGSDANAFAAEVASLILSSSTLMTNISSLLGKNVVEPAPANVVSAIPTEEVIPPLRSYLTASPLT